MDSNEINQNKLKFEASKYIERAFPILDGIAIATKPQEFQLLVSIIRSLIQSNYYDARCGHALLASMWYKISRLVEDGTMPKEQAGTIIKRIASYMGQNVFSEIEENNQDAKDKPNENQESNSTPQQEEKETPFESKLRERFIKEVEQNND